MNKPQTISQPLQHIRVVLVRPQHPGNIGSTARAMKTMGLRHLVLVAPQCDFPHEHATALASNADDILQNARLVADIPAALAEVQFAAALCPRLRELTLPMLNSRELAAKVVPMAATGLEVALVFGPEESGLTTEDVMHCNQLVMIPANPDYSSLNLAAAVQVMAYECRMQCDTAIVNPKQPPLASQEQLQHFYAHLEQVLVDVNFLNPSLPRRLMQRMRRLFNRAELEKEEVDLLRGMLRNIDQHRPR
jgi:tRNA/rRNA methyltransferase